MRVHLQRHIHTHAEVDRHALRSLHVLFPPRPWFWAKPCVSEQPSPTPSFFCSTVSPGSVPFCPRAALCGGLCASLSPTAGPGTALIPAFHPSETARVSSLSLSPPVSSTFVNCLSDPPPHARTHARTCTHRSRALTHVLGDSTIQEDTSMASGFAHHRDLSAWAPGSGGLTEAGP